MMDGSTLQRLAADPAEFRKVLTIPAVHGPARFVDVMAPFQAADFAAIDPALLALKAGTKPPIGRYWFERTKGASKDSDLAVSLLWLLAFSPRPLTCQVGAADQDQADELRKAAKEILRLNPWLGQLVTVQSWSILNARTDARCEIIAADVAGSHGARPDVLILNELSHIGKKEFAENLLDNAAKVPHGLVCIATNAGFVPSWQWDLREMARQSPRWYFSAYSQPAPWLDAAELAERKRSTAPSRYARLWKGVWCGGGGDALDPADVKRAIVCKGPLRRRKPGHVVIGGVDVGLRRDSSAFAVLSKSIGGVKVEPKKPGPAPSKNLAIMRELGMVETPEREETIKIIPGTGRLRLCDLKLWRPKDSGGKVSLERIERHILAANEVYQFDAVAYDPHQFEGSAERLEKAGLPMVRVAFTGPALTEMASTLLTAFSEGGIQLFDHEQLLADLAALRIEEKSYGCRLVSPRTRDGHGDTVSALCVALMAAKDFSGPAEEMVDDDAQLFW